MGKRHKIQVTGYNLSCKTTPGVLYILIILIIIIFILTLIFDDRQLRLNIN